MWMDYTKAEVSEYHPLCEKALNAALIELGLDSQYKVLHHQMAGTLEMDFAIQNITTKRYLCVVEVKRTPSDVQSARYQYQAMSYVQNINAQLEKPFYILTNLEYSFVFRYDQSRTSVFQQMLEPGLMKTHLFKDVNEIKFMETLKDHFVELIGNFINNKYEYLLTLESFQKHMDLMRTDKRKWKSSLVILLYEYIRGAFLSIGRPGFNHDVVVFKEDIKHICDEAARINFKGIFDYNTTDYLSKETIPKYILSDIFDFGKQNVTGDIIADALHQIASKDRRHGGEVPTDSELARIVAIIAKHIYGNNEIEPIVCDPAAGSGNLINSAAQIFGLQPKHIKVNDINPYLMELLSLRLGLSNPHVISTTNFPIISTENVVDLPNNYFDEIDVIVMNPPFLAGINSTIEKELFFKKIKQITGNDAITSVGQAGLESVFLELICHKVKDGTIIACILPKTHLVARGRDAIILRRILLGLFGLEVIFDYPRVGIFQEVLKDTCVVIGRKNSNMEDVKIISSLCNIADIDTGEFEKSLDKSLGSDKFYSLMSGIEAKMISKTELNRNIEVGWRITSSEMNFAIDFLNNEFYSDNRFEKIAESKFDYPRGRVANSGGKELLFVDTNEEFYNEVKPKIKNLAPGINNSDSQNNSIDIGDGFAKFFGVKGMNDTEVNDVIDKYSKLPQKTSKQQKKPKTNYELKAQLLKEQRYDTPKHTILIPRNIRANGQIYLTTQKTYVSTNFFELKVMDERESITIASWMTTIFYQLICEVNKKDQEGARKMEKPQIGDTLIPKEGIVTDEQYDQIKKEFNNISFLDLRNPEIRDIDKIWAEILYGSDSDVVLDMAKSHLKFLVKHRNG